jgi:hypothetical protein
VGSEAPCSPLGPEAPFLPTLFPPMMPESTVPPFVPGGAFPHASPPMMPESTVPPIGECVKEAALEVELAKASKKQRLSVEAVADIIMSGVGKEAGAAPKEAKAAKAAPKKKAKAEKCAFRCEHDAATKTFSMFYHKLPCKSFSYTAKTKARAEKQAKDANIDLDSTPACSQHTYIYIYMYIGCCVKATITNIAGLASGQVRAQRLGGPGDHVSGR